MIPHVINYVWIGNSQIPERELLCIKSWINTLSDYKINFFGNDYLDSLTLTPLMEKMKKRGKWAFLSDYVRLKVLQTHPGIYLDTDIFMVKPFTEEMLSQSFFAGMGEEGIINQGVIGFDGSLDLINQLISHYESLDTKFEQSPMEYTPELCKFFNYQGGVGIKSPNIEFPEYNSKLYSREYFYPCHWSANSYKRKTYLHNKFTDNTICIHLWTASAQPASNHNWVNQQIIDSKQEIYDFLKFNKVDDYFLQNFNNLISRWRV